MSQRHLTVGDLLGSLTGIDPRTPVRLALSPEWPFEHYVGAVTATPTIPATSTDPNPHTEPRGAVWIGDGGQIGHLPAEAWVELHHDPYDDIPGAA
ncbi:hypothetical protein [Kitasatospora sp. NBC_01266]|uniref:hypothetical protein n=1 Tax=Kitasatospora sp. NBC_01266 TaxID=2903572 RepID=UPI002E36D067|nr:hypothetical protein [Kitasatospora sp. NBC_01266]